MAKVKDIVCGMQVEETSKFKTEYEGTKYYFCSPACKKLFNENPKEYLKGKGFKLSFSKLDLSVWWQRIIFVTILAAIFSIIMFFINEKPFSEESKLRNQEYNEFGHGHLEGEDDDDHHE